MFCSTFHTMIHIHTARYVVCQRFVNHLSYDTFFHIEVLFWTGMYKRIVFHGNLASFTFIVKVYS